MSLEKLFSQPLATSSRDNYVSTVMEQKSAKEPSGDLLG